jgi:hypothetical protein
MLRNRHPADVLADVRLRRAMRPFLEEEGAGRTLSFFWIFRTVEFGLCHLTRRYTELSRTSPEGKDD